MPIISELTLRRVMAILLLFIFLEHIFFAFQHVRTMGKANAREKSWLFVPEKQSTKSSRSGKKKKKQRIKFSRSIEKKKKFSFPCGDWIPHGGNYLVDVLNYTSSTLDTQLPSCGSTETTRVGQEIHLDSQMLHCRPNLKAFERKAPILTLDLRHSNRQPEYTIVAPSHNVADVLKKTVKTICETMVGLWEVIFVLDSCYDDSLKLLKDILLKDASCSNHNNNGRMVRARIVENPTGVYETSSDNIGFLLADASHFIIELQSDMFLKEVGWNRDLARPALEYNDIVTVSGRCGHNRGEGPAYSFGRCGMDINEVDPIEQKNMTDTVMVTATNNRGPLLFRVDALRELGYLDEVNFFLGEDDHDFNRRANYKGWFAAYKYVHFYAPTTLSPRRHPELRKHYPDAAKEYDQKYKEFRFSATFPECDPQTPPVGQLSLLKPKEATRRSLTPLNDDMRMAPLPPLLPLRNLSHEETTLR